MTVVIQKELLIPALDNGRVRFIADGDLTPPDVDEILRANADRLADSSDKYDKLIEPLFEESATKVTTHRGTKRLTPHPCRIKS